MASVKDQTAAASGALLTARTPPRPHTSPLARLDLIDPKPRPSARRRRGLRRGDEGLGARPAGGAAHGPGPTGQGRGAQPLPPCATSIGVSSPAAEERGGEMLRPEVQAPPSEARKYTTSSRIIKIQARISERALELLALPDDGVPKMLLDIGCGSGLSGETLTEHDHHWIGCDIS